MKTRKGSETVITVIGGGASGMTAAISAAKAGAGTVRILEKNAILGRKLLATGNGRCNLTNTGCSDVEASLGFFSGLGLLTRTEDEGRVYPYSEQASSVQESLLAALNEWKVEILCNAEITSVEKTVEGFQIKAGAEVFASDALILATGGKAGPQFGSSGDGYRFARAFGHNVVRLMPSLVQMVSDQPFFKELKGVRTKGTVCLMRGEETVDRENGEIQFTEDGLSGICVFNLSRAYEKTDSIRIDLFPDYDIKALTELLREHTKVLQKRSLNELFSGMLHKKLIPVLLNLLSLDQSRTAGSLQPKEIDEIASLFKGWGIPVSGTKGWKEAQVTSGGVDLSEVDPNTMESGLVPGLYFAGELLDVDEKCGGFNLQWAWISGMTAGKAAAEKLGKHYAENT